MNPKQDIIHSMETFFKSRILLTFTLMTLCLLATSHAQTSRSFPPMFNLAMDQTISTTPAQSTCGVQSLGAFCRSSTVASSVTSCVLSQCSEDCPTRTIPPPYVTLLNAGGYGLCVTPDAVNVYPRSAPGSFSTLFLGSGSGCYLVPTTVPAIGASGAFTVTFWVWLSGNGTG